MSARPGLKGTLKSLYARPEAEKIKEEEDRREAEPKVGRPVGEAPVLSQIDLGRDPRYREGEAFVHPSKPRTHDVEFAQDYQGTTKIPKSLFRACVAKARGARYVRLVWALLYVYQNDPPDGLVERVDRYVERLNEHFASEKRKAR